MDYHGIVCPACGDTNMAPIIYGYPTPEMVALARQDIVALGGTSIGEDTHYCYSCNVSMVYESPRQLPN